MTIGTYLYGLEQRVQGPQGSYSNNWSSTSISVERSVVIFRHLETAAKHEIRVAKPQTSGGSKHKDVALWMDLNTESGVQRSRAKKLLLHVPLFQKLQWRYRIANGSAAELETNESSSQEVLHKDTAVDLTDSVFVNNLCAMINRRFEKRFESTTRTVTPDLYSLWFLTSNVSTELFADCINESAVLAEYCSSDKMDKVFGAIGSWEDVEQTVQGGAGNPPFESRFLQQVVSAFEAGCLGDTPYCRCVLLPLGKKYGLIERISSLSSKGILLVTIPPESLPFRHQEGYFAKDDRARYHGFQELGLFIWRNRQYLDANPSPEDVELLYMHWVARNWRNPSNVYVCLSAFEKAFPFKLRSKTTRLQQFI